MGKRLTPEEKEARIKAYEEAKAARQAARFEKRKERDLRIIMNLLQGAMMNPMRSLKDFLKRGKLRESEKREELGQKIPVKTQKQGMLRTYLLLRESLV